MISLEAGFNRLHGNVCELTGGEQTVHGQVPYAHGQRDQLLDVTYAVTEGDVQSITRIVEQDPPVPVAAYITTLSMLGGMVIAQRGLAMGWNVRGITDPEERQRLLLRDARYSTIPEEDLPSVLWGITIDVDVFTPDEA
jgi:hypothetical protein